MKYFSTQKYVREIEAMGFSLIPSVFRFQEIEDFLSGLTESITASTNEAVLQSRGTIFAARNIVELFPNVIDDWKNELLVELLISILGESCGMVRVLYFDKPSHRSWSLPFHKDLTIAVKDNSIPTKIYSKPTYKADVAHVEADEELLRSMLTLRIHLDDVTPDNGPLQIIPKSHLSGKHVAQKHCSKPAKINCHAGDVLAMRPLATHASFHSHPEKSMSRRVLHLEFSPTQSLQDSYEWFHFFKVTN